MRKSKPRDTRLSQLDMAADGSRRVSSSSSTSSTSSPSSVLVLTTHYHIHYYWYCGSSAACTLYSLPLVKTLRIHYYWYCGSTTACTIYSLPLVKTLRIHYYWYCGSLADCTLYPLPLVRALRMRPTSAHPYQVWPRPCPTSKTAFPIGGRLLASLVRLVKIFLHQLLELFPEGHNRVVASFVAKRCDERLPELYEVAQR